jgi:mannose-6-phosphate isomerase-like protein (cupin superfamily)
MKISNIKKLKDLDKLTIKNKKYRKSLYRSTNLEFVLMSIPVDKDIPLEVHKTEDQFIRVEEGECKIVIGKTDKKTSYLKKNDAVIIPQGLWHQIFNTGNIPLKIYVIYAPSEKEH